MSTKATSEISVPEEIPARERNSRPIPTEVGSGGGGGGGSSNVTQTSRIVGGTGAPQGKYPYFVQWARGCGASLIHSDMLLTAAHCDGTNIPTSVIVGAYQNGQATFGAQARQVVERSRHPKYSSFDEMRTTTWSCESIPLSLA
jgi:hypothetical protein